MFTGIIEEVGKVISAQPWRLVIGAYDVLQGMKVGGSIAVNGACLTMTSLDNSAFSVDIMLETARRTNLGLLKVGDKVNLERPLTLGGQLGGHLVQGHIDDTGRVASLRWESGAMLATIMAPPEVRCYLVEKSFVAVDGVSLTVVTANASSFQVSIVEYTRQHTILGGWRVGDVVNLEVDIIAKYVEQLGQNRRSGVTVGFLREHGFLLS